MASGVGKILCCLCGVSIEPNAAAMCIDCLNTEYSITDDIDKNLEIIQCKKCERWHSKLDQWIAHDMESTGLLNLCLRKVNALSKKDVKILHAAWVWTEPHSRRLQISVDIERGVLDGKVELRQRFIVEFVMIMRQCPDCARLETEHTWGAMIQIRQNTGYKRSIYHLESLLIKSGYSDLFIDVEVKKEGIDIYFNNKSHAEKVADFISSSMPTKSKVSKKLVSHNTHTHIAKQEWTLYLEIASLMKDDLVLTTRDMTGSPALMIVIKIASVIHMINPLTLANTEFTATKYFATNPTPLLSGKQLERFIVMDIVLISTDITHETQGKRSNGWALAEAEIAKESDFGENDRTYRVITHLGNILQAGDLALGYDLVHSVANQDVLEALPYAYPDVMLVRKTYPQKPGTAKKPKKASGGRRRRRKLDSSGDNKADDPSHEKESSLEQDAEIIESTMHEDADDAVDNTWLDVDDIEYELYRQQVHDEAEMLADIAGEEDKEESS